MRKGNKGRAARGANRSVDVASGRGGGGQQGWSSRASCSSWRGRSVHLPVSIIEKVRRVRSMAGELKALRAESGANAADPVLKQAAPATTAESTTARCAQEREQANWSSVCGAGGPVAVAAETGRAGGSVLARAAGHTGWHRRQRPPPPPGSGSAESSKGSDSCHRRRSSAHVCRAAANAAAQDRCRWPPDNSRLTASIEGS